MPWQHLQCQQFQPSKQIAEHSKDISLAHTATPASRHPQPVNARLGKPQGPGSLHSQKRLQAQQVPHVPIQLGPETPLPSPWPTLRVMPQPHALIINPSRPPSQTNTLTTRNKTSPSVPVKAIQIFMPRTLTRATMNTPHHSSRPRADPQAHNIHETDNCIHVGSTVRTEQSLAMSFTIDGQQYRTAANVLSCRHSILTQQMLEFDAGFPMHYTETLEALLHSLRAWTTSRCPTKKSPGDHVDGG